MRTAEEDVKEKRGKNCTYLCLQAKATMKSVATRVAKQQISMFFFIFVLFHSFILLILYFTLFDREKIDCGVPLEVDEYVRSLHFGMMEVTYEWARQLPFKDICDLTGTFLSPLSLFFFSLHLLLFALFLFYVFLFLS